LNYEIVVANDGSRDRTYELLESAAQKNRRIKVINFSRNFGHEAATTAALHYADADYTLIIDADLQDQPEFLPEMMRQMQQSGADVVYGVRRSRKGESFVKKFTSKMFYRFFNMLSDIHFPVDTGDFRLINRKVLNEFKGLGEKKKYVRGLFTWIGFQQEPFYYERAEREAGDTKYNYKKLTRLALDVIFSFSKKPLQISFSLGILCILVALTLLIYVMVSKAIYAVPGWASTVTMIIFFGGIQLFMIGVLGEYLSIIFDEVKRRPEYIVTDTLNLDDKE
jgi:dolichol-phosphate mannosyltransferase